MLKWLISIYICFSQKHCKIFFKKNFFFGRQTKTWFKYLQQTRLGQAEAKKEPGTLITWEFGNSVSQLEPDSASALWRCGGVNQQSATKRLQTSFPFMSHCLGLNKHHPSQARFGKCAVFSGQLRTSKPRKEPTEAQLTAAGPFCSTSPKYPCTSFFLHVWFLSEGRSHQHSIQFLHLFQRSQPLVNSLKHSHVIAQGQITQKWADELPNSYLSFTDITSRME